MNNLPKLRFPEFWDAGDWEEKQLHQIASPVSERAKGKNKETALTLSAEYGIVSQGDYFGKRIAGENVDRYIKISLNDFVYNDRITKLFTYGTIKRLSQYQSGLVSPIYKCFRFKESENPVFWEWYFESGNHEIPLQKLVNEGARAGRFNISIQKFLSITVLSPESSEQQKIADCLSSIADHITLETQKLDTLKAHKKGLMQKLFPAEGETLPKLRFPEFQDSGEWDRDAFDDLLDIIDGDRGSNYPKLDEFSNSGHCVFLNAKNVTKSGFKFEEIQFITKEKDNILRKGKLQRLDVVLTTRGSVGQFALYSDDVLYDNIRINSGMVVLRIKSPKINADYLYTFCRSQVLSNYIENIAFGNAQQQLTVAEIKKFQIFYPQPKEQQKIADCLSSIDEVIAAQSQAIDLLKLHKKGLMQQLFPAVKEVKV